MARNNAFTVFIVDDDSKFTTMCQHYMDKNSVYNLDIHAFATGEDCLAKMDELKPEVVVLDYYFDAVDEGAKNGMAVLDEIKAKHPTTHVVMISAQDNMETAIETVRRGATDYIIKSDTAIMFTQLTTDKILREKAAALAFRNYRRGVKVLIIVMSLFILGLVGFLVAVTVFRLKI